MSIEDEVAVLSQTPVLAELDEQALRVVAFSADKRDLRTGETLVLRGERSDGGYFVVSGSFSLHRQPEPEPEADVVRAGGLIGEMALITPTEHPVTAIAREPSSVLKIPRNVFQRVLREYPGSAARVRAMIEHRLVGYTGDLQTLRQKLMGDQ